MSQQVGTVDLPVAFVQRYLNHLHPKFAECHPDCAWRFHLVRVPVADLRCGYDDPGLGKAPGVGLMGSVGLPPIGWLGRPIAEMATLLSARLVGETAIVPNAALESVIALRDGGRALITSVDQPYLLSEQGGSWVVIEGTKRSIALVLLGEEYVEGLSLGSARLVSNDSDE